MTMSKYDGSKYKSMEIQLEQGARSRHMKAMQALETAEDFLPDTALEGTKSEIVSGIRHLETATANLNELLAYRKMIGID